MSRLSTVEAGPHVAVVVGDLACITLRGPHGVLASELGVRGTWSSHLRLSSVLHWSLGLWCVVAEVSGLLETILLACLALQKLALVILSLIDLGPLCEDCLVHQGVEIRVDLRGEQSPEFWVQSLFEHILLLFVIVHFFRCVASQLHKLVCVLFNRHIPLLKCAKFIRLALHGGRGDVVTAEFPHEFIPGDGGGISGGSAVILPPGYGGPDELICSQKDFIPILAPKWLEL